MTAARLLEIKNSLKLPTFKDAMIKCIDYNGLSVSEIADFLNTAPYIKQKMKEEFKITNSTLQKFF